MVVILATQTCSEQHCWLEDKTMEDVYYCTQQKVADLESHGCKVIKMWECQWSKLKESNQEVKDFVNQLDIVAPLNPRDAFCSGRTNTIKLYHQTEADEEIDYYYFTSLYPFVKKNKVYPTGHPEIIFEPRHRHFSVLWYSSMYSPPTLQALSSSPSTSAKPETDIFAVPHLCGGRNRQTHARMKLCVPSHASTTSTHGDLVHAGTSRSSEARVSAFP